MCLHTPLSVSHNPKISFLEKDDKQRTSCRFLAALPAPGAMLCLFRFWVVPKFLVAIVRSVVLVDESSNGDDG